MSHCECVHVLCSLWMRRTAGAGAIRIRASRFEVHFWSGYIGRMVANNFCFFRSQTTCLHFAQCDSLLHRIRFAIYLDFSWKFSFFRSGDVIVAVENLLCLLRVYLICDRKYKLLQHRASCRDAQRHQWKVFEIKQRAIQWFPGATEEHSQHQCTQLIFVNG